MAQRADEIRPEQLIWSNIIGIFTAAHLHDWISTIEQLTAEQRQRVSNSKLAEFGCIDVADKLWLIEADKPTEEQRWDTVLDALRELSERSSQLDLELLWACAIRAEIIVLAEYQHDLETALATAETALSQASDDSRVQFLIRECMGRQYVYVNYSDEALIWLSQALNQTTNKDIYPLQYLQVLLHMSRAIGPKDPHAVIDYVHQAVSFARTSEPIPETEMIKALGELTIAHWLAGDLLAAFESLDEAGERLLTSRTETNAWKDTFVLFGHVSGYLSLLAYDGQPPTEIWNGEPYGEPRRGMFFTHNPARAVLYDKAREGFVLANLAMFAEAVGRDERAATWALRGIDAARTNHMPIYAKLSIDLIPHLLLDNRMGRSPNLKLWA